MKFYLLIAAIIISALSGSAYADVKVKAKMTTGGQSFENTTYIKGKRQRTESMNGISVGLTQCDLRQTVQLNPSAKTYILSPFDQGDAVAGQATNVKSDNVVRVGGTITTTVSIKDTGERKQMFGYTARHLIITTEMASSPDACNPANMKMQTDGWYIDAEFALDCDMSTGYMRNVSPAKPGCQDKYVSKQVGVGKRGFPVYETLTMFDGAGKETFSTVNEVIEFSRSPLDAALFEVPAGYRQVRDTPELYAAGAAFPSASISSSSALERSIDAPTNAVAKPAVSKLGPTKPGTIRIGLAGVKTGSVGESVSSDDLAAAVRDSLAGYLKAPNVEVVTLDADLPAAIDSEAGEKECDIVLNATVSHKKGGGGFGAKFGSALNSAISSVPYGSTGSTAGNIGVATAKNAAIESSTVAANFKSKDEITLDIRVSGSATLTKQIKAKAKADREDIISIVTEQAAQAVAASLKQ